MTQTIVTYELSYVYVTCTTSMGLSFAPLEQMKWFELILIKLSLMELN